jgi:uncharacterized membrane protein
LQNKWWVNGLLKMQNPIEHAFKRIKSALTQTKLIFIHGIIILVSLTVAEFLLYNHLNSFLMYLPPIGFAFFLLTTYIIQPIIIGVLNIAVLHRFYKFKGWQIGFWKNGLFLFLIFSTFNLFFQIITRISYLSYIFAISETILLAYPFGIIAKLSNGNN